VPTRHAQGIRTAPVFLSRRLFLDLLAQRSAFLPARWRSRSRPPTAAPILVLFVADRFDERTVRSAPALDAVPLDALALPHLPDMAFRYDVLEFNTAIKPSCIEFRFDRRGCLGVARDTAAGVRRRRIE
jgi:hypothetical protein